MTGIITTSSIMISDGTYHDVENLNSERFSLENIAIALGNLSRWGGHLGRLETREHNSARRITPQRPAPKARLKSNFYSVAEHSVLGARYFLHREEPELAKLFLLHDAAEPFVGGDIPTPLKNYLTKVSDWEFAIQQRILNKYGLAGSFRDVKEADRRICRNECIGLYDDKAQWAWSIEPLCYETGFDRELIKLHKWKPEQAMNEWYELAIKLGLEN